MPRAGHPASGAKLIEGALLELEPEIRRIADQGAEFQGKVGSLLKTDTGSLGADLVSEADYWVQKQLLELFLANGLEGCELVAEESTPELQPLLERFTPGGSASLFIDPIDGTKRFLEGLPYFSTIISVRRGAEMLYSFCYYPKLSWWIRLLGQESFEMSGAVPVQVEARQRTVVYTSGSADVEFADWSQQLEGWDWSKGDALHPCGSKLLYLSGQVGGYASSKPNLYDGLMIYHYARVRRHSCQEESLQLDRWESSPWGLQLGGRYLCMQPEAQRS